MDKQLWEIFFYHKSTQCSLFNIYGSIVFTALMNILIVFIVSDTLYNKKCFKILKEFYRRQGFHINMSTKFTDSK